MDYDEQSIHLFLKGHSGAFVSPRVISRRVGGKQRFLQNPEWATPVLIGMLEKGILEMDAQGRCRLKNTAPVERLKRTWISPQVRRVLEQSHKDFSGILKVDEEGPA